MGMRAPKWPKHIQFKLRIFFYKLSQMYHDVSPLLGYHPDETWPRCGLEIRAYHYHTKRVGVPHESHDLKPWIFTIYIGDEILSKLYRDYL